MKRQLVMLGVCLWGYRQAERAGVAVLLSERLDRCLEEQKYVDEMTLRIRLNVEGMWLTVIHVYAPIDDSNREVKTEFLARLQETVGSMAKGDVLIVLGDLNTRVGNDTEVWGEILGEHGEAVCNKMAGSCLRTT